jgi:formate dehydrogenase iron-sulfur subunit
VENAVIQDEATGAVVYLPDTKKAPYDEVRQSCPYNIPRQAADGQLVKCTMCIDRISNGLLPACVKTCPTGAMNFGDREAMLALGNERLAKLKERYPKAQLLDADSIRTIFLVTYEPDMYCEFAVAGLEPSISRKVALRKMFKPARDLASKVKVG